MARAKPPVGSLRTPEEIRRAILANGGGDGFWVEADLPAGPQGPQGPPGKDGATGPAGPAGPEGPQGADSTVPGPEGPAGADGQDGAPGADGQDGAPGLNGADGKDGADGADGAPGVNGADGKDGLPGDDGKDGLPGVDGQDGPEGPAGPPGPEGPTGQDGAPGADGRPGADGNVWHVGSGDPAPTLGSPGDYYLDGESGWVWVKRTDTSWTNLYTNLTGPPGADGQDGADGTAAPHDHDYLPLAGGTLTGDLVVGNVLTVDNTFNTAWANVTYNLTVGAQLNVGTDFYVNGVNVKAGYLRTANGDYNWPSHSFDNDPQTGFYLATTGTMGAAGNLLINDNLQVEGDLQVDGNQPLVVDSASGAGREYAQFRAGPTTMTMYGENDANYPNQLRFQTNRNFALTIDGTKKVHAHGDLKVEGDLQVDGQAVFNGTHDAIKLTGVQPYMSVFFGGTRAGYFGFPSAASGGVTTLHADANTLELGGAAVKVSSNLQVNGNLNVGTEFYVSGQDVKVGYLRAGNGSKGWPSHSFDADKQTGFYLAAGGYIGTAGNLLINDNLQVEGQIKATNGSSAAPVYSFQADSTTGIYLENASSYPSNSIISITANGVNAANFGDKGVSLPVAYAQTTGAAPNVHIDSGGQILRSTSARVDAADISRLETLVEKLSARIEMLEGQTRL